MNSAALRHNVNVCIPSAPRGISDLAALEALSPIEHTFKAWGRLSEIRADRIASLISEALASR